MKELFFQSSMPRSMSTVFQNIMGQNPLFYVTPTSGVLDLVCAARQIYTEGAEFNAQNPELMKKGYLGFAAAGVKGYFDQLTDKPYVLDKCRGHAYFFDLWEQILGKQPKMICLVRDLRDVVTSMEKFHRRAPHLHNRGINHATMAGIRTHDRVDQMMAGQPVGIAVNRLLEVILLKNDRHILFIRAEDLCLYPHEQMKRVYEYLQLPPYEHNFDEIEQITQEDDRIHGFQNLHTIRTKLEPVRSDAIEILGQEICDWIYTTYNWYFKYFGYNK